MPAIHGIFRHPLSWRSRIFRGAVGLAILVLLVRLIWGWQTHRELSAKLAELRAAGQGVEAGDVVSKKVPDAQNAWNYQVQAATAVSAAESPAASNLEYPNYPPYPPAWWTLAEASEKGNGQTFSILRKARALTRVQFRDGLSRPVYTSVAMGSLNSLRNLANTVGDGALYAHLKGNDVESLDRAGDVLHLAESLRQDRFLISQLVGIGIDALAVNRLQIIAPGLRLGPDSPQAAETRQRVKALIARLLDEETIWKGITQSLQSELLANLDSLRGASDSTWFIRPLADRQSLRDIRNLQVAIEASRLRNKPAVEAMLARIQTERATSTFSGTVQPWIPRYSRWFNTDSTGSMSRYLETNFRVVGNRRVAAVALAAQLYHADHGGWPGRLEELVPAYLPALPADPYHDDGRALGYVVLRLADGSPRPMVYFDAGDTKDVVIGPEPIYEWEIERRTGRHGRDIRQYRDLSRFAPPAASTKAVENDPQKTDAPGDAGKD